MPGLADYVLAWTAQAVVPGARITQATGLRDGGNPWLLRLERAGREYRIVLKTGDPSSTRDRTQLRTQVAALALVQDHGLPAPRVIASELAGSRAGVLAMVTSVLPGSSTIPWTMPAGRARSLGAVAAAIHAVALTPQPDLPARTRPLPDVDFNAWRRSAGTTPLLARAEQLVSDLPVPGSSTGLVHGDLWQGNTLWSEGVCTGVIDWDCAGAGPPGIDLGTLRLDAALYYGPGAADQILHGWREAAGRQPDHTAYWDVVAALTTVGDMAQCMPPVVDQHRLDLDARTLTARRDAFLSAALTQLGALRRACGNGGQRHRLGSRIPAAQQPDKTRTRQHPDVRALCVPAVSGKAHLTWGGRAAPLRLKYRMASAARPRLPARWPDRHAGRWTFRRVPGRTGREWSWRCWAVPSATRSAPVTAENGARRRTVHQRPEASGFVR